MKFWILETNQVDCKEPYKLIDFPQITQEMFENDDHINILLNDLKERDLNTFSSFFQYDEERRCDYKEGE